MRRKCTFALLAAALTGCASGPVTVEKAMSLCARGATAVEVTANGSVAQLVGNASSATATHEGFVLRSGAFAIRVENNTTITGQIPLSRGEAVSLQGQYECNDGVIHWTHHDPRGRHIGGFIEAGGKIYR
ncbi:MAG TPA: DUF3465 domain-containing protein [Candidatus Rubrimentiphilum sp.]|nr:DUF3465 domain-containing protein [Candidatus Rubrimentiphilum sp.]